MSYTEQVVEHFRSGSKYDFSFYSSNSILRNEHVTLIMKSRISGFELTPVGWISCLVVINLSTLGARFGLHSTWYLQISNQSALLQLYIPRGLSHKSSLLSQRSDNLPTLWPKFSSRQQQTTNYSQASGQYRNITQTMVKLLSLKTQELSRTQQKHGSRKPKFCNIDEWREEKGFSKIYPNFFSSLNLFSRIIFQAENIGC